MPLRCSQCAWALIFLTAVSFFTQLNTTYPVHVTYRDMHSLRLHCVLTLTLQVRCPLVALGSAPLELANHVAPLRSGYMRPQRVGLRLGAAVDGTY